MDKDEARAVARARIDELRELSLLELRDRYFDDTETVEIQGPSGTTYQVETSAFWDGKKDDNLRVVVAIDDGGFRAFFPLSESFIVAPDGSFVGE